MNPHGGWKFHQRWIALLVVGCVFAYLLGAERQLAHQIDETVCHRQLHPTNHASSLERAFLHDCHNCLVVHPRIQSSQPQSTGTVVVIDRAEDKGEISSRPLGNRLDPARTDRAPPA